MYCAVSPEPLLHAYALIKYAIFIEIEKMRKQMEEEIRQQLLANQQMLAEEEDSGNWDQKVRLDFCLFDLIRYVPSAIFQLNRDRSSWVEPVLS